MERVFGTRLTLRPDALQRIGGLAAIADQIWAWAWRRGPAPPSEGFAEGDFSSADGSRVVARRLVDDSASLFAATTVIHLQLSHPDSRDRMLRWVAEANAVTDGDAVEVGVEVSIERHGDAITSSSPRAGVPLIVKNLVGAGAYSGRIALREGPMTAEGDDEIEDLIEGLLRDPDRRIPVIVVTPRTGHTRASYAVDYYIISELAKAVTGTALVVCVPDPADTFTLTDLLGRELSVFNGAVRLYWPRLSSGVHPLLMPDRVNPYTVLGLGTRAVRRAAASYRPPRAASDLLAQYRRRAEEDALRLRIEHFEATEQIETLRNEVTRLLNEVTTLRTSVRDLEQEVADRGERIGDLELTAARLRADARRSGLSFEEATVRAEVRRAEARAYLDLLTPLVERLRDDGEDLVSNAEAEQEQPDVQPEPDDIEDALLYAMEDFGSTLELTANAEATARRLNLNDVPVRKVWRALQALDVVARRWQSDGLPAGGKATAFQQLGFEYKRVSEVTVGQHRKDYGFSYRGQWVYVDQHLKLSRRDRIYWYEDDDLRKFIVNQIGYHLPDSTT